MSVSRRNSQGRNYNLKEGWCIWRLLLQIYFWWVKHKRNKWEELFTRGNKRNVLWEVPYISRRPRNVKPQPIEHAGSLQPTAFGAAVSIQCRLQHLHTCDELCFIISVSESLITDLEQYYLQLVVSSWNPICIFYEFATGVKATLLYENSFQFYYNTGQISNFKNANNKLNNRTFFRNKNWKLFRF